jgi:hypothetical protein
MEEGWMKNEMRVPQANDRSSVSALEISHSGITQWHHTVASHSGITQRVFGFINLSDL